MTLINNTNGNGGNGKTRLHIQKQMPDGVSINVFGDYPDEVVALLISTIELCDGTRDIKPVIPAQKELPAPADPQPKKQKSFAQLDPVCPSCQSAEHVKFIQGTNKGTGKPFARHKCEACNKWI